jgi:hypothetical protein
MRRKIIVTEKEPQTAVLNIRQPEKRGRVYIGDIIEVNENFTPVDRNGLKVDMGWRILKGFVVSIRGDYYGIRFGEGLSFTNYLDGLLGKPVGYLVHRDQFDVVEDI